MYDYKVTRDDNGHGWYCSSERIEFYTQLAKEEGYTITVRPTSSEEWRLMFRGI